MQNHVMFKRPDWTIIRLIRWATSFFESHDIDSPRATAEILLAHVLNVKRIDLYLRHDQPLTATELKRFKAMIKRRMKREPVAYIIGQKAFWTFDLVVNEDVLIPRPETECLVEAALAVLADDSSTRIKWILDLGTGSGAVILSLAQRHPVHVYFAMDVSYTTIRVAKMNAHRHRLENKIHFAVGNWLTPLHSKKRFFDMIVSNPPYIRTMDIPSLQPEIAAFEPLRALDGGPDGLCSIKAIIESAHLYLKPHGILLLEIAHNQKEDVRRLMMTSGQFDQFVCKKDYSGFDRVIQMQKKYCERRDNLIVNKF